MMFWQSKFKSQKNIIPTVKHGGGNMKVLGGQDNRTVLWTGWMGPSILRKTFLCTKYYFCPHWSEKPKKNWHGSVQPRERLNKYNEWASGSSRKEERRLANTCNSHGKRKWREQDWPGIPWADWPREERLRDLVCAHSPNGAKRQKYLIFSCTFRLIKFLFFTIKYKSFINNALFPYWYRISVPIHEK